MEGTENDAIVRDLRLPRTLLGVAVGAALGLAGGVMQTLTRNPLADPGLLGVNAGASAAVVTAISGSRREGSPHELRPEYAVLGPAGGESRSDVFRVVESALRSTRNPPPLGPQRLVGCTEVRLWPTGDSSGLQRSKE
jgi:hypothetical protein